MRTSSPSTDTARNAWALNKFSSSVVIKPASFGIKAAVMGAISLILSEVVDRNHEDQSARDCRAPDKTA